MWTESFGPVLTRPRAVGLRTLPSFLPMSIGVVLGMEKAVHETQQKCMAWCEIIYIEGYLMV
jgi:hypothetical protein